MQFTGHLVLYEVAIEKGTINYPLPISYMMYLDKGELRRVAGWPGVNGGARERLMDKLQGQFGSLSLGSLEDLLIRKIMLL